LTACYHTARFFKSEMVVSYEREYKPEIAQKCRNMLCKHSLYTCKPGNIPCGVVSLVVELVIRSETWVSTQ